MTFQVEEPRFAAPGRGLQKAPRGLLQLLSRALARLDKAGPTRVGLELVFQQDGQTVRDVVGLDDVLLMILLCPLPRANSRQDIAAVIGDDLHRHAQTFAERAQVRRDRFAVAARQHSHREHLDIVMSGAVAFAA